MANEQIGKGITISISDTTFVGVKSLTLPDQILNFEDITAFSDPAYAAGTTYPKGYRVISSNILYISLQDDNTGNTPASSPLYWRVASNKWDYFLATMFNAGETNITMKYDGSNEGMMYYINDMFSSKSLFTYAVGFPDGSYWECDGYFAKLGGMKADSAKSVLMQDITIKNTGEPEFRQAS